MTSAAINELMTRVGPATGAGKLLRQYWQPAALSEELDPTRPVIPVRLLGEDLVLFRDSTGRLGLMDRHCPHRGVDLSFGRLEDGGLRCPFHGWLFDVTGQCLEQPAEPAGRKAYRHLRHRAHACEERNGVIFAYLGEGTAPTLPAFDCFVAPQEQTFAFKGLWECNWLQALEVGIDPAHPSYLHRFLRDETADVSYGRQFRGNLADSELPLTRILRESGRPGIELQDTAFGFRLVTTRALENARVHFRITNLLFPNAIVIPMSSEMTITQWHVPIDDVSCYWYAMFTSFGAPVDRETMRRQRLDHHTLPMYRPKALRQNRWGFDPADQAERTYTGLGMDVNVQDQWAVESPGAIVDRTREHLAKSDVGIIKYRRLLLRGIEELARGERVPFALDAEAAARVKGPIAVDAIGSAADRVRCWEARDRERRRASSWAQALE